MPQLAARVEHESVAGCEGLDEEPGSSLRPLTPTPTFAKFPIARSLLAPWMLRRVEVAAQDD
jgi:hypothetical protein